MALRALEPRRSAARSQTRFWPATPVKLNSTGLPGCSRVPQKLTGNVSVLAGSVACRKSSTCSFTRALSPAALFTDNS